MYDSAEYELNCPSKDELKEQLIIVGYRVDASHPDLDHPATIGKLLLACEELVQARGQTIEMFCGMFRTWQGSVWGPGQGRKSFEVRSNEPWKRQLTCGQVAARLYLYLKTPLPKVKRGRVISSTDVRCSECGMSVNRYEFSIMTAQGPHALPIECEHCGALLESKS
jgi:hypothetical protein